MTKPDEIVSTSKGQIIVLEHNLYNILHGVEPTAQVVFNTLNIAPKTIARLRDAYVTYMDAEKTKPVFVILTRTGGNNRRAYDDSNLALVAHPNYLDDADDQFDMTFALFRFRVPTDMEKTLLAYLEMFGVPKSLHEKTMAGTKPDFVPANQAAVEGLTAQLRAMIEGTIE